MFQTKTGARNKAKRTRARACASQIRSATRVPFTAERAQLEAARVAARAGRQRTAFAVNSPINRPIARR